MTAELDLNATHYSSPTVTSEALYKPYSRLAYAPISPGTVTIEMGDGRVLKDNGQGELIIYSHHSMPASLSVWGLIHYGSGEIKKLIAHATYNYDPEREVPKHTRTPL